MSSFPRTTPLAAIVPAFLLLAPDAGAQGKLLTGYFGGDLATGFSCPTASCLTLPQQVGANGYSVTLSSPSIYARIGNADLEGKGFTSNGYWSSGMYASPNSMSPTQGLRFTFAQPVYAVGAWMNYANDAIGGFDFGPAYLRTYGAQGQLLDEFDLRRLAPIVTTGGINAGAFRGIENLLGIHAFELAGSFAATHDLYVSPVPLTDDGDKARNPAILMLGPSLDAPPVETVTPEPSTYLMMAVGLAGLTAVARKRVGTTSGE